MTTKLVKSQKKYEIEKAKKISYIKCDKKSVIILLIIVFTIVVLSIFSITDIRGCLIKNDKNWTTTNAKIESIDNQNIVEQTRAGSLNQRLGHNFRYTYIIDGVTYNKDIYLNQHISQHLVNYVLKLSDSWDVEIYYKKDNPEESYINTDTDSDFYKKRK